MNISKSFQNNGKLNKITYGNGFSVSYVYNVLELLTEVWYNYTDRTSKKTNALTASLL